MGYQFEPFTYQDEDGDDSHDVDFNVTDERQVIIFIILQYQLHYEYDLIL